MNIIDLIIEQQPKVRFSSYYKYSFTFTGTCILPSGEQYSIVAIYGGDSDDIYRTEISANEEWILCKANFRSITVENLTTKQTSVYLRD